MAAQSIAARREKLIIGYDPMIVKLDGEPEGRPVQSTYNGTEYQYFCNDGAATLYLPKTGQQAIIATGARKGDQIEICKSLRYGYVATLLSERRPVPAAPAPLPARVSAAPAPAPARVSAPVPAPVPAPAPAPAPVRTSYPIEDLSRRALEAAARVVKATEDYCHQIGLPVEANFEDVRALAIHWLISREKNGGAR